MTITLDGYTAIDMSLARGFPLLNDGSFDVDQDLCGGGVQELYEGIEFLAPTGLDFNLGNVRYVPVIAQGQVQTTFQLPSIDAKSATLRAAYEKFSTDVLLTNTKTDTIGEAVAMGIDNDKSGQEKLMAFVASQLQAHDTDDANIWANILLHRCRIRPNRPSLGDTPMAKEYTMSLGRSTKRMWGETYTESTHGRTEDIGDVVLTQYKLGVGIWMGNGEYADFVLPANKLARTSAAAKVWDFATGGARAGSWDASTDAEIFTPSVLVADQAVLFVTYQYGN